MLTGDFFRYLWIEARPPAGRWFFGRCRVNSDEVLTLEWFGYDHRVMTLRWGVEGERREAEKFIRQVEVI